MKSIKPGRGPSFMGGIMNIFVALFGVFWTIMVSSFGGGPFALFGVFFVIFAIINAVYNFKNATSKNRYSTFDITDAHEEQDPLNKYFGESESMPNSKRNTNNKFCPYCGTSVADDFEYCNSCGKKLP